LESVDLLSATVREIKATLRWLEGIEREGVMRKRGWKGIGTLTTGEEEFILSRSWGIESAAK